MTDQTIQTLTALGLYLFSVDHPDLPRCVGRHGREHPCDGQRGKHPEPWSWSRESTNDPASLARMFGRGPRNIGIDCARSALVVLDEDAPGELDRLCRDHDRLVPETFTVFTGKGRHFYFRQAVELPFTNAVGALRGYRIDVRGRGGYVVGPGSRHATGRTYSLAGAARIAPVPEWVANLLRPPAPVRCFPIAPAVTGSRQALAGVLHVVFNTPSGGRNCALYWASRRMWEKVAAGQLAQTSAAGMLLDVATAVGLSEGEARGTIGSARRAVLG